MRIGIDLFLRIWKTIKLDILTNISLKIEIHLINKIPKNYLNQITMTKKIDDKSVQISLTDFIEYVSKVGTTKFTKVKEIKNREPYHPAFDFWKPLREKIIEIHKENKNKNLLDEVLNDLTDKNKINLYPNTNHLLAEKRLNGLNHHLKIGK